VFQGWALRGSISVLAALLCATALLRTRSISRERIPWTWIDAVALIPMLAVIASAVCWSLQFRLGWDSLMIWEAKAYIAWQNGGILPSSYFADAERVYSQPFYPLLWPYLQAWFYGWNGAPDQRLVSFLSIGFLVTVCAAFTGIVQRLGGPRSLGLMGGAMLFGIPYLFSGPWGLFSGYADFPLGVFLLLAIGYAAWWMHVDSAAAFRLLAASAALLPWIKREGLFLCVAVLLVPCIRLVGRRDWRRMTVLLIPVAAVIGGWGLFLRINQVAIDPTFVPVTWNSISNGLGRVRPILGAMGSEMADPMHWSVLWLCVPAALIVLLIMWRWSLAALFACVMVVSLAGDTAAYLLSSWEDYLRHLELSFPRLVLQLAPTALLAFLLAFPWKAPNEPADPPLAR
jgi:hypothetical protein